VGLCGPTQHGFWLKSSLKHPTPRSFFLGRVFVEGMAGMCVWFFAWSDGFFVHAVFYFLRGLRLVSVMATVRVTILVMYWGVWSGFLSGVVVYPFTRKLKKTD
jgi:hypothetical protein